MTASQRHGAPLELGVVAVSLAAGRDKASHLPKPLQQQNLLLTQPLLQGQTQQQALGAAQEASGWVGRVNRTSKQGVVRSSSARQPRARGLQRKAMYWESSEAVSEKGVKRASSFLTPPGVKRKLFETPDTASSLARQRSLGVLREELETKVEMPADYRLDYLWGKT